MNLFSLIHRRATRRAFPFAIEGIAQPDAQVQALFRGAFRVPAPDFPLHYVARWRRDGGVYGYVHYTQQEPGVYLCGGLCVDIRPYRSMDEKDRAIIREAGSLSRWLLQQSIELLTDKRAVFAYTGNIMSLRDCEALGFVATPHRHLIVQWHGTSEPEERESLLRRVASIGPF